MNVRDIISAWTKNCERIRRNQKEKEKERDGWVMDINRGREKLKTGHCKRINDNWHVSSSTN